MIEGNLIRIPIPPLSEERRKELSKVASQIAENSKISIRNIRRDIIEDIKKKVIKIVRLVTTKNIKVKILFKKLQMII